MNFHNINKDAILNEAQNVFPNKIIEVEECDLFLKDYEDGEYRSEFFDTPFYVSTQYAYEDHLVNGNQTRYKITIPVIFIKQSPYEILYRSSGCYFVVYEDAGELHFIEYEKLQELLSDKIHKIDK